MQVEDIADDPGGREAFALQIVERIEVLLESIEPEAEYFSAVV